MIYIGILIGVSATLIALQIISVALNLRGQREGRDYQERTLAALERRNEIGEGMNEHLYYIHEELKK